MIFLDSGKSKPQLHGNVLATLKGRQRLTGSATLPNNDYIYFASHTIKQYN